MTSVRKISIKYNVQSGAIITVRYNMIWVRSRNCGCLVTWFCYQLIAKPGNKTAEVSWPDPYYTHHCSIDLARIGNSGCANEILGCAKCRFWWKSPWKWKNQGDFRVCNRIWWLYRSTLVEVIQTISSANWPLGSGIIWPSNELEITHIWV